MSERVRQSWETIFAVTVKYRLVKMIVMKSGIANNEAIRSTGSKQAPKTICTATPIGTWKATDIFNG